MRENQLLRALGQVDEVYITESAPRRRQPLLLRVAAAACLFAGLVGIFSLVQHGSQSIPLQLSSPGIRARYVKDDEALSRLPRAAMYSTELISPSTGQPSRVLRGTVHKVQNLEIDFGEVKHYLAAAEIEVQKDIDRAAATDANITVLLPGPVLPAADDLFAQLDQGTEVLLLLHEYGSGDVLQVEGRVLRLDEVAEFGLFKGSAGLFLQTDAGLRFDVSSYPELSETMSLEEVENYFQKIQ